ncbi:protein CHUP1, chloroplastic [Ricinus communis]|uniref:protein CHUP1, chloroplastic n=1 Tax=Ricinus communis TaxID=3988 RepID=UPI00201A7555|nr:protein CHUP1, chloroplastic [Ricinus communis]XP_048235849.1 protein CHUP1, chloroplastic [Ricinus communis]
MESSRSKTEVMKPLFLKAGIPLALSVASFIYARIISRRVVISDRPKVCSLEANNGSIEAFRDNQESSIRGLSSLTSPIKDDEEAMITSSHDLSSTENSDITAQEQVLGLRSRVEELQKRELDLEMKFLRYHVMKEQELVLMELKNMLVLEAARLESLDREISSIEAEKERFQNLVADYFGVLEQIECVKLENRLLRRKAKRLSKKTMEQSRIIREKNSKIDAAESEILSFCNEIETRSNVIKKLEDDVRELQIIVDQLQEENNELLIELNAAEISALSTSSKIDAEFVPIEDYNQLANELEQLRKDRASENAELIYLKWANACSKHELMRIQEHEEFDEKQENLELELEASEENRDCGSEQQENKSNLVRKEVDTDVATSSHDQGCSKRKKLLHKLKRWVEGSGDHMMKPKLEEKEKEEIKCFGRLSLSEEKEEDHIIHARRSCSSA